MANIAMAVVKFLAESVTAGSAMLSDGIHSTLDSGNGLLLRWRIHKVKRPADGVHPFGQWAEILQKHCKGWKKMIRAL